jgi:DNA (cytosine-5)-methyltransferase 1
MENKTQDTKSALDHGYYSVGENRGRPRIWLQGGILTRANFNKGVTYDVIYNIDDAKIILKVTNNPSPSSRIVSGKRKPDGSYSPIIDLAKNSLLDVTQGAQKIRADAFENEIHITVHHHDSKRIDRENRLKENLKNGTVVKADLCVGIGVSASAIKEGIEQSGLIARTEFIVDKQRKYLDIALQNNHAVSSDTKIFEASLEEIEPELLSFVDLLNVSLECAGSSPSGKAKNGNKLAEEHAGALGLVGLIRILDACQPSIITSENVVSARNSASYLLLKSLLTMTGYNIEEIVLDSDNTHSIENRKRYWFVATSAGLPRVSLDNFPEFTPQYSCLSDLLDKVDPESKMWKSSDEKIRKAAVNKANGKNFGFNLVDGSEKRIGVCGRFYQKSRSSEPHLKGEAGSIRLISTQELARAQSVPEKLIADTVTGHAYEGLGQGIDYRQGLGIGMILARDIFSRMTSDVVRPLGDFCKRIESSIKCVEMSSYKKNFDDEIQIALF